MLFNKPTLREAFSCKMVQTSKFFNSSSLIYWPQIYLRRIGPSFFKDDWLVPITLNLSVADIILIFYRICLCFPILLCKYIYIKIKVYSRCSSWLVKDVWEKPCYERTVKSVCTYTAWFTEIPGSLQGTWCFSAWFREACPLFLSSG